MCVCVFTCGCPGLSSYPVAHTQTVRIGWPVERTRRQTSNDVRTLTANLCALDCCVCMDHRIRLSSSLQRNYLHGCFFRAQFNSAFRTRSIPGGFCSKTYGTVRQWYDSTLINVMMINQFVVCISRVAVCQCDVGCDVRCGFFHSTLCLCVCEHQIEMDQIRTPRLRRFSTIKKKNCRIVNAVFTNVATDDSEIRRNVATDSSEVIYARWHRIPK